VRSFALLLCLIDIKAEQKELYGRVITAKDIITGETAAMGST
jgi:hypothetical protein